MRFSNILAGLVCSVSSQQLIYTADDQQVSANIPKPESDLIVDESPSHQLQTDPDYSKSFQDIVAENGFGFESLPVVTKDGYKLNVFRIKDKNTKPGAPVVFFQHGILDSADCWIMNYASKAPAFVAARAGYDVWLGNNRGTKFSMGHVSLDVKSEEFWDFSYSELGKYDAPAQIEAVLKQTGRDTATYVGHAQGTTQFFMALATEQEYWKSKVNLFVAAAPVTKVQHTQNDLIKLFSSAARIIGSATKLFHVYDIGGDWETDDTVHAVCKVVPQLCKYLEKSITLNPDLDDSDRYNVYMGHYPSPAALKELIHYGQSVTKGSFQAFDYGSSQANKKHYGTSTPPLYNLENITETPVGMFVGIEDELGDIYDNRWAHGLINTNRKTPIHYEELHGGHESFIVGKSMTYFSEGAMGLIKKYNPL